MATNYRAGCCAQCLRPIRNAYKWEPIFYISDGPVYLHPKCADKYNGTEEEPHGDTGTGGTTERPPAAVPAPAIHPAKLAGPEERRS